MPDSPFIGPTYPLASKGASVARTVNMMPVPLEAGNERTGWVFKDVPGLVAVTQTAAPVSDNVVMLLHMNAAGPYIDQVGRTVTTVGSPTLLTSDYVFGPASYSGTYTANLSMANSGGLMDFGVNPFAFDVWWKNPGNAGGHFCAVVAVSRDATDQFETINYCIFSNATAINHRVQFTNTTSLGAYTATLTWDTIIDNPTQLWHHSRFGRVNSTTIAAATDGIITATGTVAPTDAFTGGAAGSTLVGASVVAGRNTWPGLLDEVVARKSAMNATNFSVPIVPFVYP